MLFLAQILAMMWAGHVKCMDKNKQSICSLIGMENCMESLGSVADNQNVFGKRYMKMRIGLN
jgi:hypothetical protein